MIVSVSPELVDLARLGNKERKADCACHSTTDEYPIITLRWTVFHFLTSMTFWQVAHE